MTKFWVKKIDLLKTSYYQVMVNCKYSNTESNELRGACYKNEQDAIDRCKWEEMMYSSINIK